MEQGSRSSTAIPIWATRWLCRSACSAEGNPARQFARKREETGDRFSRRLNERFGNHPFVGDVRGRGLFRGIEIVADRGTKEPFDPARKINAKIKAEAMKRGLMVYPMGGTVDGTAETMSCWRRLHRG